MFFITGGAAFISGVCTALGLGGGWLASQMRHVPWAGLAHHDTIFPLFLFLAGVAWPFSLAAQRARGASEGSIHLKLLRRVVILFLLGFSFVFFQKMPQFRLMTVLGFIGLSWGIAALLFMHIKGVWTRFWVFAAIAVGYFALLHFGIMPGAPLDADPYSKEWNVIRFLDLSTYPEHLMIPASVAAAKGIVAYEPESLFSVPGGVLIALLGMFSGVLLRSRSFGGGAKTILLFGAAILSAALAWLLVQIVNVPIVKALWTVSFVFAASAYSLAMLALFYLVVDVWGVRRWTVVFDPVGKNSILAYMLMMTGVQATLRHYAFEGLIAISGVWGEALSGLSAFLISWCILRFCQKKGVYLKV